MAGRLPFRSTGSFSRWRDSATPIGVAVLRSADSTTARGSPKPPEKAVIGSTWLRIVLRFTGSDRHHENIGSGENRVYLPAKASQIFTLACPCPLYGEEDRRAHLCKLAFACGRNFAPAPHEGSRPAPLDPCPTVRRLDARQGFRALHHAGGFPPLRPRPTLRGLDAGNVPPFHHEGGANAWPPSPAGITAP